jgi:hypothetical protein
METDPPDVDTTKILTLEKERLLNQLQDIVKVRRLLEISRLLGEQNLQLPTGKLVKHSIPADQPSLTAPSVEQTGPTDSK